MSLRLLGLHVRKENDFIPTDSFSDVGNLLYDKKGNDTVYRKRENEYQQIDRTEAGRDKGAESRSQMTVLVIKISMIWSRMEQ